MNLKDSKHEVDTPLGKRTVYLLNKVSNDVARLPYSIKVLLESGLRNLIKLDLDAESVASIVSYQPSDRGIREIPFMPSRVVLQDFTGVPAVVDLAAMRDAIVSLTGDASSASKVNPLVPCDLVIDHSVQVDAYDSVSALTINSEHEFERNLERYKLLKWAQGAFQNFRVVPPATGIVHQVNLEHLAKGIWDDGKTLYPDSLVGTDSHTTMINGLGVIGWGVGGIEAEAVMCGQPIFMAMPEVVGVKLIGQLKEGVTATDLVLRVTELLRNHGVVGKFVEFYGPALDHMPLANRATIANMAPEYGATIGFFPIDNHTINYLNLTGRGGAHSEMVEWYAREQGLWRDESITRGYSAVLELNLEQVEASIAGPSRPQDRVLLRESKKSWLNTLGNTYKLPKASKALEEKKRPFTGDISIDGVDLQMKGQKCRLRHGSVVIAAITSCTNTSNPGVMVAAGLVARAARERGITSRPWVKTSLAPGSRVVTEYLTKANLLKDFESIGYYVVGYGCTTCIGNSGPLPVAVENAIRDNDLVVCSVLSGNRNFEGRISPDVTANYLASPPLVVAYALAGRMDIDFETEPIGHDSEGEEVYLRDIWPTQAEIDRIVSEHITVEQFDSEYKNVFEGSKEWQNVDVGVGERFNWDNKSTYVQDPPFFHKMSMDPPGVKSIVDARVLAMLGDSVTTDHISPAGSIPDKSPASNWLTERGVSRSMFNSFGSRRGNDRIMTRGTFGNIRVKNKLAEGQEGGWTRDFIDNQIKSIFDASENYRKNSIPLIVIAGKDYGMGSSRDWAAKGTRLLGVRAVIAESFERIHRSNLIGMGVLPLQFLDSKESIALEGDELFSIQLPSEMKPREKIQVAARSNDGGHKIFSVELRADTPVEVDYLNQGGILHAVLRRMACNK